MFRVLLTFLIFLSCPVCYSIASTPVDSLKYQIKQIENRYKADNDSLQRELLSYKVKEDFYSDAFSAQGTLYSALMAIIATIIVAIGLGFINTKINNVQATLQDQISRLITDTELLHGSNKINFATSIIGLGHHAHIEAEKSFNENRYASTIVSGFHALFHYSTAFSLNTEALSQEESNEVISEILSLCAACTTLLSTMIETSDREIEQIYNYKKDLIKIVRDTKLDDLVMQSVTGIVRANYFTIKTELASVLKQIK